MRKLILNSIVATTIALLGGCGQAPDVAELQDYLDCHEFDKSSAKSAKFSFLWLKDSTERNYFREFNSDGYTVYHSELDSVRSGVTSYHSYTRNGMPLKDWDISENGDTISMAFYRYSGDSLNCEMESYHKGELSVKYYWKFDDCQNIVSNRGYTVHNGFLSLIDSVSLEYLNAGKTVIRTDHLQKATTVYQYDNRRNVLSYEVCPFEGNCTIYESDYVFNTLGDWTLKTDYKRASAKQKESRTRISVTTRELKY